MSSTDISRLNSDRFYATVSYFGAIYHDAEFFQDQWWFEDMFGGLHPFLAQHRVMILSSPRHARQEPPAAE